jgi:hypothetical protein
VGLFMSRHENSGHSNGIRIANKLSENVANLMHLGTLSRGTVGSRWFLL